MRIARSAAILPVCALLATAWADTLRSDLPQRQELKRADLSSEMEVITSISEIRKGEMVPRLTHHGFETG